MTYVIMFFQNFRTVTYQNHKNFAISLVGSLAEKRTDYTRIQIFSVMATAAC
jgi:hypothetical protein